jgi:hypothetical protein
VQHLSFQARRTRSPRRPSSFGLDPWPRLPLLTIGKVADALAPANDVTNGNSPPLTVNTDSVLSLQPWRRPNQLFICFWTVSPEVENLTGPNCGSGSNNGETSTPDLAGPARSTNYLFRPIRWNLRSCITSKVQLRNLRLGTALKSCQTKLLYKRYKCRHLSLNSRGKENIWT